MLTRDRPANLTQSQENAETLVASSSSVVTWGSRPQVFAASRTNALASTMVQGCVSHGVILSCPAWVEYGTESFNIHVYDDTHHSPSQQSSSIQADLTLDDFHAEVDRKPLIEAMIPPRIQYALPDQNTAAGIWVFDYPIYSNKLPTDSPTTATITTMSGNIIFGSGGLAAPNITNCDSAHRCHLTFTLPFRSISLMQDQVKLLFFATSPSGR